MARSVIQGSFHGGSPRLAPPSAVQPQAARPVAPQAEPRVVQRVGHGEAFQLPAALSRFGSGGEALPEPVRHKMESYFGASFAEVRVHVGREAPAIGALAFTHGSHLYFAPGRYDPASAQGQQLIGHELAHVIQQRAGRVRNPFASGVAVVVDRGLEAEAERQGLAASVHRAAGPPRPAASSLLPARPAASRPAGSVQPMSFARFSTYGFLSNWGSYNAAENALLALETRVKNFYGRLTPAGKSREAVKKLKRKLDAISASTVAEGQYPATTLKLQGIEEALEVERKRQFLETHGYPEKPVNPHVYAPGGVKDDVWQGIVTKIPDQEKRYLHQGAQSSRLVDELFRSFCTKQGFQYRTFGGASALLSNYYGPPEASCHGLTRAFADVLNAYEIEAEPEEVKAEQDGVKFIVKLDDFIDRRCTGNIYYQDAVRRGYYVFSNHFAVWVKSKNCYYDPMAMAIYGSLDRFVDCELQGNGDDTEYVPIGTPKTLLPSFKWKLVYAGGPPLAGGFPRMNVVPIKKKKGG